MHISIFLSARICICVYNIIIIIYVCVFSDIVDVVQHKIINFTFQNLCKKIQTYKKNAVVVMHRIIVFYCILKSRRKWTLQREATYSWEAIIIIIVNQRLKERENERLFQYIKKEKNFVSTLCNKDNLKNITFVFLHII